MLFQPGDAFRVEMVGRLVEQQDRRLFEQQPGQRDAALFTARQGLDARVARWAAQRFHRDFELVVEGPAVDRVDLFLKRSEEHTSELQSLMRISYAVFCLKKKKTKEHTHRH